MNNREIDAKIAVISSKDATKLGIKKQEENLVTIDGQVVEVEWVDEFGEDWHLPNIVLKAQTYLKTLRNVEEKQYVNVYSNKFENFERIVNFDVIEGTTLNKVREFLVSSEYGPESAIDEFNYGLTTITNKEDVNKVLTKINDNISLYRQEYETSKSKLSEIDYQYENFEISDDEYIEERSEALADLQILSLSIYRDLVLLNSLTKKTISPELAFEVNSTDELVTKLDALAQQVQQVSAQPSKQEETVECKKCSSNESANKVKTWTVEMTDPRFANLVEWTPEEFESISKYEPSQETKNESVENSNDSTNVKVWTVELKKDDPQTVQKTQTTQQNEPVVENKPVVEEKTTSNTTSTDNVEFQVEMVDPVYYYCDEWTTKNSFGGNENKSDSKQAKSKGFFKDLNVFKKKKNKKGNDVVEEVAATDDYYLVTDVNGNTKKISAKNPNFKGVTEWEDSEFTKEHIEKFANFEVLEKNYAQLMDKSGTLLNQKRRVVTEEEKLLDQQIHDIQSEIDELESQLNEIKNK